MSTHHRRYIRLREYSKTILATALALAFATYLTALFL